MASPIPWQLATVGAIRKETPTVRSFSLSLPEWGGHRAGQHVDLRLTAEDGYSVERSYSIASEPERSGEIDLTVERIEDGEVSPFLHDVVVSGDRIEVRGRAADGDAPPPVEGWGTEPDAVALLLPPSRRGDLPRRARPAGRRRRRPRGRAHPDTLPAGGLD